MGRRLTVLVQAYACNPNLGSEEGVGWGWVKAIAEHHDLHVLTAEYHRTDIEAVLEKDPILRERIQFHFVPPKKWHYRPTPVWKAIENSVFKPLMNYSYRLWQKDAYRLALGLFTDNRFDLVHVITYVGFRFPGHYWKLPLPLVWGPIGGLENTPWRYFPILGVRGSIMYAGRNILNTLDKAFLTGPKRAFRKAEGGVIAATSSVSKEIQDRYGVCSIVRCEIGAVDIGGPHTTSSRDEKEPLRIIWSGLHVSGKALPLLLQALQELPRDVNWQLTVLGDGPLTKKWKATAASLGIAERIVWPGRVSRDHAIETMAKSHLMVISSVYDLTSSVLIEALSVGLPVVCPDHYGFRDAVDETCGFRVAVSSLGDIRDGFTRSIRLIHDDESLRRKMAYRALEKSREYRWEKTGKMVAQLYETRAE